ncbi:MAG: lactate racemase domain-containing protein [Acidobacteriota bacterium]
MSNFPRAALCTQKFARPRLDSIEDEIQRLFLRCQSLLPPLRDKRLAVAVGSRGITDLLPIVRTTVGVLKQVGASPFIVPAMGSHGGATPEGQSGILAEYGISPAQVGVPVKSSLETTLIGETSEGVPVPIDRVAFDSDGIILVNRVKPHTDFKGEVESGLMKMIAVGLGNRTGADSFHSWTLSYRYDHLIQSKARVLLETGKVQFGIAILENAYHETAQLELIPAPQIPSREKELLVEAKGLMPSLPVGSLDVLILNQIGKDISGSGMDPNITGRWFRIHSMWQDRPDITRIVVLDLSESTAGNATGIGLADFCAARVVKKMDRQSTYLNAVTSRNVVAGHLPLHFDTDRETLLQALRSLGSHANRDNVRLLRIQNTLSLIRFEASQALLPELRRHPRVTEVSPPGKMKFDEAGNLKPLS